MCETFSNEKVHSPEDFTRGLGANERCQPIYTGEIRDHFRGALCVFVSQDGDTPVKSVLAEALRKEGDGTVAVQHLEPDGLLI